MGNPSTDKMGTGVNFIRAVLQIKRSVNGPYISDSFSIELSSRQTNTHTQTRRHINSGGSVTTQLAKVNIH
jgi:hypothetical protein